jgi:hypothetical protein
MEHTWLVQRLRKPQNFDNPFSFGGGYRNGGLSDEAMSLIKGVWSFDYMGSAEFEFGEVPKALQKIAQYSEAGKAVTGQVSLIKPVYYFCEKDMKSGVEEVIRKIANDKQILKEPTFLKEALEGNGHFQDHKGWLELDNGFMFFVCNEMYKKSLDLFGIKREN